MTTAQVVLLVVAIVGSTAMLWALAARWVSGKSAQIVAALATELAAAGEPATRGPEAALYRGADGARSRVKGNGVIALTGRRVLFRKLLGNDVEVPLAEVIGVRESTWFLRAYNGRRMHLILQLRGGEEVGFKVGDHPGWMAAMRERIATPAPG